MSSDPKPFGKDWFRRFEQAPPEERVTMLAVAKAQRDVETGVGLRETLEAAKAWPGTPTAHRVDTELDARVAAWQRQAEKRADEKAAEHDQMLAAVHANVKRTERDIATHDERMAWLAAQAVARDSGGVEPVDLDALDDDETP